MTARRRPGSVEMAHPVADRRRRGDHIGDHVAQSLFAEPVDRTRTLSAAITLPVWSRTGAAIGVEPVLEFLDGGRVSVPRGGLDLRLEFAVAT